MTVPTDPVFYLLQAHYNSVMIWRLPYSQNYVKVLPQTHNNSHKDHYFTYFGVQLALPHRGLLFVWKEGATPSEGQDPDKEACGIQGFGLDSLGIGYRV